MLSLRAAWMRHGIDPKLYDRVDDELRIAVAEALIGDEHEYAVAAAEAADLRDKLKQREEDLAWAMRYRARGVVVPESLVLD